VRIPQAWTAARYKIPERSGEVLVDPPLDQIPSMLCASRDTDWGRAHVLGIPLAEFRHQARKRALHLAGDPSAGSRPGDEPLVVMGHQPLFFHPGVWMKFFLLTRLARQLHVIGLHLIVDSDASGPVTASVPAREDRPVRRSETLLALPEDVPLGAHRPPTAQEWSGFCERVRAHLATLPAADAVRCFDAFVAGAGPGLQGAATLATFLAQARRGYEARAAAPRYLEVTVSSLAETPEFRLFVLHLLQDPQAFRHRYNGRLDEYRRLQRLRSPANPFPNLGEVNGFHETPLWIVHEGRRADLYAAREGDRVRLRPAGGQIIDVPAGAAGVEALAGAGVIIWPKAITLTMFARLCVGDLFIHGVSGGRYDRVTDAVAAETFGCAPPPYVVASATLHLPLLPEREAPEDARALKRRLMDLQHNPERHLDTSAQPIRRLVDEKWDYIRSVEAMRPGPERRAATHRIRELNARLAGGLASEIASLEARLAAMDQASAVRDAIEYRGYPFFLFHPTRVAALAGISCRS
jgi:hypothetical protein